jgi:hypothetical protein
MVRKAVLSHRAMALPEADARSKGDDKDDGAVQQGKKGSMRPGWRNEKPRRIVPLVGWCDALLLGMSTKNLICEPGYAYNSDKTHKARCQDSKM